MMNFDDEFEIITGVDETNHINANISPTVNNNKITDVSINIVSPIDNNINNDKSVPNEKTNMSVNAISPVDNNINNDKSVPNEKTNMSVNAVSPVDNTINNDKDDSNKIANSNDALVESDVDKILNMRCMF